jgi:hypothetical protein
MTLAALISGGSQVIGGILSRGDETQGGFEPSDMFSRLKTALKNAGATEEELAQLQQSLFRDVSGNVGGALPQGLGLEALAGGQLPQASLDRIRETAFGGIEEGARRATRVSQEMFAGRGLPMSSLEAVHGANLMQPLISQAAQLQAQLQMGEMGRLSGLRQQAIQNQIAVQESPALQRLLQIRLAQPETNQLQMSRFPGGLPDYTYGGQGAPAWGQQEAQASLQRNVQSSGPFQGPRNFAQDYAENAYRSQQGGDQY